MSSDTIQETREKTEKPKQKPKLEWDLFRFGLYFFIFLMINDDIREVIIKKS